MALLPSCAKESEPEPVVDANPVEADSSTPEKPYLSLPDFDADHLAEGPDGADCHFLAGSIDPFVVLNINVVDPRPVREHAIYAEELIQFYHEHNGIQPDGILPPARPDVLHDFDYLINWEEGAIERTNKQSGDLWVWNLADGTITYYDKNGRKMSSLKLRLANSRYGDVEEDKTVPWGMDPRPYIPKNK
ncbi:MAG: hypothetical protein L3J82_08900 [Planctomycetes bacterium]|nr:hypothetical protein [Planctomycetota bacterium]